MKNDPWPHNTYDDFLSDKRFYEIQELAKQEFAYLDMFGFYSRSGHYFRFVKDDIIPEINLSLLDPYKNIRKYNKPLKKLIHWSIHPENFSYPPHIDNDSRIFTAVLYIEPKENIGTILCKNNSDHSLDHGQPTLESEYEVEVGWQPNRLFTHCSVNGKTWHRYSSSLQRTTLNVFFVDEDKILPDRMDKNFLINIEGKNGSSV